MVDADLVKTRFPEFDDVSDDLIKLVIAEASRFVDDTWQERDRDNAVLYLTAHMLAMGGYLAGSGGPTTTRGGLVSEKLGDASETYGQWGVGAGASEYEATSYGRLFLRLLRLNFPAVAII